MLNPKSYRLLLLFSTALFIHIAKAQKLPKIQQGSMRAPANIKIDGNIHEWGDNFKAYNPGSRVYYSVANDEKYLYLIAKMDGRDANWKALAGGFSFGIQPLSESKDVEKKFKSIVFPAQENRNEIITDYSFDAEKFKKKQTASNTKSLDSLSKLANRKMQEFYKEMEVSGMDEEGVDRLSLYNTEGIKVSPKFNSRMEYTLEIAIPLKFLGLNINTNGTFKYNIILIGTTEKRKNRVQFTIDSSGLSGDELYGAYSTNIWGDYTLIK